MVPTMLMVSPTQWEKAGRSWTGFSKTPSGTGPFRITKVVQLVGEVLRVADTEDLRVRIMTQAPGWKGDRGQMRPQVARRVTITRRIRSSRTAVSFPAIRSICQLPANGVRGLSSRKQRAAKLAKWLRSNVRNPPARYRRKAAPRVAHATGKIYLMAQGRRSAQDGIVDARSGLRTFQSDPKLSSAVLDLDSSEG